MVEGLTVERVTTNEGLNKLGPEWHELFIESGCRNVLLTPEWASTWWSHWGNGHRLAIIAVRDKIGRLIAVAPFYIRSMMGKWGIRKLCFLGDKHIGSDYQDLLSAPGCEKAVVDSIINEVRALATEWDAVELLNCAADSHVFGMLRASMRELGMREIISSTSVCPFISLPESFDEYLAMVGDNVRYNFRRRLRALERNGKVDCLVLTHPSDIHAHFGELLRLHQMRFGQKNVRSDFLGEDIEKFHADLIDRLGTAGMARLLLLRVNGETIAALYGFTAGKRFTFFQSGMDPSWSRLSAGLVMMGCSIRVAIQTGHDEFDFLEGLQPYKLQWAKQTRGQISVKYCNSSIRGRLARVITVGAGLLKRMLPVRVRHVIKHMLITLMLHLVYVKTSSSRV